MTKINNLQLPLALHEATIEHYRRKDAAPDAELEALGAAMAQARQDIERFAVLAEAISTDRTHTVESNALRLRQAAVRAGERAAVCLDGARVRAEKAVEQIRTATYAPPAPKDDAAARLEVEIRQRLAAMPHQDRGKVIAAAIKDDDDLMVGAILRAPPMLCGMSQVEHNYRRALWRQRRYPNEVDREQRLEKAVAALDRGGAAMLAFIKTMTASPEAEAAETGVKAVAEAQAAVK